MAVSAVKKEAVKPAADDEAAASSPKKKSFNWKLPVIALCVIGAAGGGAYWYMNRHHGDSVKEAKVEPAKPPQFLPLDPFTVNLQLEENPQYLQVGLTLRVADNAVVDALKLRMPEVRDRILLLLSSQKASALLTLEGKRNLVTEILRSVNAVVAPGAAATEAAPKAAAAAADADTTAAAEPDADAKPAAEAGAAAAAAPATVLPVQNVLFTSFIVQ